MDPTDPDQDPNTAKRDFFQCVAHLGLGLLLGLGELLWHGFAVGDQAAASALGAHGVGIGRVGGRPPHRTPVGTAQVGATRQRILPTAIAMFVLFEAWTRREIITVRGQSYGWRLPKY